METDRGQFLGQDKDKNSSNVRSQVAFQMAISRKICHHSITTICSSISELLLNISLSVLWALTLLVFCPLTDTLFFSPRPLLPILYSFSITGARGKEPEQKEARSEQRAKNVRTCIQICCAWKIQDFPAAKITVLSYVWHLILSRGKDKINHLAPECRLNSLVPHTTSPHRNLGIEESHLQVYMKLKFPFLFQENFFLQTWYLMLQWKSLFLLNDFYISECKLGAFGEDHQEAVFPFSHAIWEHASINQSGLGVEDSSWWGQSFSLARWKHSGSRWGRQFNSITRKLIAIDSYTSV